MIGEGGLRVHRVVAEVDCGRVINPHSDNSEWTDKAKKVLEATGAEEISSAGEAKADFQKSDRPLPLAS